MPELRIFVVEDDEWYAEFIRYNLSLDKDVMVEKFLKGRDCLKRIHENPDAVTIDYRLPDMSGEELMKKIREVNPEIELIIISEQEKIEIAVSLLKQGAFDYIVKSKDIRDRIFNIVRNLKKQKVLKTQVQLLQEEVQRKYDFEKLIIGKSKPIRKIFNLIEKAINTNISVTITGETGTGKELVAKAIHYNSSRKKHPFVAINMAAIPRDLVESELFGHEKGAFTSAHAGRKGKFEEANNGTLFLDEIGEMDLTLQAKLLRVLQEREVTPVGSNKSMKVNSRIIVASNKNLLNAVREQKFRDDLYYRLFGLNIEMPPLRARDQDIIMLARHFISTYAEENNIPEKILTREARKKLMQYTYPGNVRELKSVVELAMVMSDKEEIGEEDISFSEDGMNTDQFSHELTLREHNLRIVKAYLQKYDGNVKKAAGKLDIGFSTIYRMLKEEPGG